MRRPSTSGAAQGPAAALVPADGARVALAAVRLTFGGVALVAPRLLVRRVQGDGPAPSAAVYAFRMFGVRTVALGGHLLAADPGVRRQAVVEAPLVHAADALTAGVLTARRQVSRASGLSMLGISLLNTGLAVAAARSRRTGVPRSG